MTTRPRYLAGQLRRDLTRKMVFVAGPRQVGKTTLARSLPGAAAGYLNWDVPGHRERILRGELPDATFWVFDELHKYRRWRGFLKGLFDEFGADRVIDTPIAESAMVGAAAGAADGFFRTSGRSMGGNFTSRAASLIVVEVRRQFKIPGLMEGRVKPDYRQAVGICTVAAQKELIGLALIAVLSPLAVGMLLGVEALGGFLADGRMRRALDQAAAEQLFDFFLEKPDHQHSPVVCNESVHAGNLHPRRW